MFGTRPECIFGKLVVTSSRLAQSFPDFSSGMAGYPTGQQPLVSGTPHFLGLAVAAALGLRVRFFLEADIQAYIQRQTAQVIH